MVKMTDLVEHKRRGRPRIVKEGPVMKKKCCHVSVDVEKVSNEDLDSAEVSNQESQ
jgi:hypothetical protein